MGATFSTIQIRRPRQTESEQFKKLLCGYFEEKGLIPATEEDAEFSYWLAFSDESSWMTLGSAEYQLDAVYADVPKIAETIKTHCIVISVWNSDFYELRLFGPSIKKKDVIVAGHSPVDEIFTKGNRKLWEPLLSEGKTWGQFKEICNGSYTFAEDALWEIAPLLGMSPKQVTNAYDCCEEASSDEIKVETLYFKRAQNVMVRKVPSLDKVFKQVFGEALEPLGFVKIKGRQPYFVRLIGDEILHIVTYMKDWSSHDEYKAFNIWGGVATVYRQRITLDKRPDDNSNWLNAACDFYTKLNPSSIDKDLYKSIHTFNYKKDDTESLHCEVKRSLDVTKQFMLPTLNKATDLVSCIQEYFFIFGGLTLNNAENLDAYNNDYGEGLLLIKTNYRESMERTEKAIAKSAQLFKAGKCGGQTQEDFDRECERSRAGALRQITIRNKILDTPELYAQVLAKLEKRKAENTEILRSYGLNI